MIDYRHTDGGRQASGRKGTKAGDCVVRAATLLRGFQAELSFRRFDTGDWGSLYADTYAALADANKAATGTRTARDGMARKVFVPVFLNQFGFSKAALPPGPRPTYTQAWQEFGACICSTSGHIAPIINATLYDTADNREYLWRETGRWQPRKAQSVFHLGDAL